MSSEPRTTASTTLTAATTSAASSAQPKLSTLSTPSVTFRSAAIWRMSGVRDQDEQEAEDERERQPQRGEHRRDDRVQRRDDRRDEQRTPEVVDVDAGQDRGGHHQRDARGKPRDEQREQPQAGTLGLPGGGLAVGRLGVARHRVLLLRARPTASSAAPLSWRRWNGLPGLLALRLLLRLLLGALGLLLGDLDLRVGVGLPDELLATRPAEDRDDEHERDEDVPGGGDQLLRGRVVDRGARWRRRSRCRARARSSPA